MKTITGVYKNEQGMDIYVKIIQFIVKGDTLVAICIYKDEIVAIAPSDLKVVEVPEEEFTSMSEVSLTEDGV